MSAMTPEFCEKSHTDADGYIIKRPELLNVAQSEKDAALINSIKSRDGNYQDFLRVGASPNAVDLQSGKPAIIMAVEQRQPYLLGALLEKGADVNTVDPVTKKTPLILAIENSASRVFGGLIGRPDLNPNIPDPEGRSPLEVALRTEAIKHERRPGEPSFFPMSEMIAAHTKFDKGTTFISEVTGKPTPIPELASMQGEPAQEVLKILQQLQSPVAQTHARPGAPAQTRGGMT